MYQYDFKKLGKIVYDRDYFSLLGIERYIINFFFFVLMMISWRVILLANMFILRYYENSDNENFCMYLFGSHCLTPSSSA